MQKSNFNSPLSPNISRQQLFDSLTSHISLYNSSQKTPFHNPNPRLSILKWFTSLSIPQRQAHLTIVHSNFLQIVLQMVTKIQSNGHGFFFILPDMPLDGSHLPSICFRKSHGLLARVAESNEPERRVRDSVRVFSSKEGEGENGVCGLLEFVDSLTVCEGFVRNVDGFVSVMDGVSNGRFLRGEESGLSSEWVELGWLKEKGYYSIEGFIANRLEVALRLAWLNHNNGGKKRGVKLKDKVNAVGVGANAFWRKKGCVDWWGKLDEATRGKIIRLGLGKAAKSLITDTLKGARGVSADKAWLCSSTLEQSLRGNTTLSNRRNFVNLRGSDARVAQSMSHASVFGVSCSLNQLLDSLCMLQDISTVLLACSHTVCESPDCENLFFSSLESVNTLSDCILRKLRGLLMIISLDCTKYELLEDENLNSLPKQNKEILGASNRKKKGKNRKGKKSNPSPKPTTDGLRVVKSTEDKGDTFMCGDDVHSSSSTGLVVKLRGDNVHSGLPSGSVNRVQQKDLDKKSLPSMIDMVGHGEGPDSQTVRSATRKKRKERNKIKNPSLITSGEDGKCQKRNSQKTFISVNSRDGDPRSDCVTVDSVVQSGSKDSSIDNEKRKLEASIRSRSGGVCGSAGSPEGCRNPCLTDHLLSEGVIGNGTVAVAVETTNRDGGSGVSSVMPVIDSAPTHSNCKEFKKLNNRSGFLEKQTKVSDPNTKFTSLKEQGGVDVYDTGTMNSQSYVSYEWPSVAPVHLPCGDSHLPPATDRLHLDVSHNWKSHFRHSFLRNVRHVRNASIETGCSGIISGPLPMSLDWPPMVRSINRLAAPSVTCNYDAGFISRRTSFQQDIAAQSMHCNAVSTEDERVYSGDVMDFSDLSNSHEVGEDHDYHWMSEEELEVHAVSGVDYNQYFGGGVMYWNPSELGTNFSRPPSLSSDDSSWAWREADMNRAVDDMVAFSSSYSTNGLTSPSGASFCSPFDPLGSGHQALGYVIPGSEISSKVLQSSSAADLVTVENASGSLSNLSGDVEAKSVDSLPYPILRPIVIPSMSRERSRSDFKRSHDHKSPCVPPSRREQPRIKRPPSPVVLCVPRAPRPPPPSPVGDSRRHRGFPTVRSGSSSPRQWGVKGWFHDGINFEEACIRMDGSEVVWPAWRSKSLSAHQLTQPLPGALLQDRLIAISQLTRDQEHPDVAFPLQPPETLNSTAKKACLSVIHSRLHDEIESFCKQVASENLIRKPYINWAVKRVARSLQVLWPRSRTNIFGSNATGLSLPSSDVDLVVCLPPVRNLEPIKEAGILEGRNGIKETCLQHAARYLANQEWVKNDSLKIVENTAIPIIRLVVEVPHDLISSALSNLQTPKAEPTQLTVEESNTFQADSTCSDSSSSPQWSKVNECAKDVKAVRLDISFKSPSHTGLQTTELVKELTEQFPAATPLALVLKQFLADRSLDQSYSGGLSSYCLVLLITRFLQHEHHHSRPIDQNLGSLLMDFFYFFGNVFDPRQIRVSIQGSGLYINRERGCSIDPICIDDPLYPTNNVGRNCFRIHQCIKAFADAYSTLENEIPSLPNNDESNTAPQVKLLPRIIPSIVVSEMS
ncbi:uncharacterized protein LOC132645746 isoform X1 [Lycium barbarum]|uniref:uncharacterized protein LOC132645746 isoform X1 n=1 Tax=Lycium barbarum TaxID=112863 RepID=UPI00293E0DDA|nr:uncharacterized protein LOC132645746 isoform X1 [Lycium barbarum]XP_060218893.1 uncharacterized protein LOC132645746 isoform X1 [Lycium barbarum]XP_060218894.1 uncharacterized protein LOC132645746 isoform X1 [Lycium barbarum]XP_060218895.1 uncharacterized protein LOC132645746 isoform X1 [Lycium barbarum]XP_060218896.1 uncharacterized protein LOC132645746 isoform X1 [Lycium barbarum]XP_060218897.1 uncharacterized protein LOC132645746 isoform X1 [Lycium barbarum]XP_060218899.1 uncharacterize